MSTYTAFDNNPVFFADPSGADSETWGYAARAIEEEEGDTREKERNNDNDTDPKKKNSAMYQAYFQQKLAESEAEFGSASGRIYGGDGSGSFMDITYKVLDEINQFNPFANLWDVISHTLTGKDRLGNKMGVGEASLKAVSVVPIFKIGSLTGGIFKASATKGGLNLFKWGAPQTSKSTGWRAGDYFLNLPNRGSARLNWKANYGALRREMGYGNPIFDTYLKPNGLLMKTDGFLNAERYILKSRGWNFSRSTGAWMPPKF